MVTTGGGLFFEANHCRADATVYSSDSHNCLGDGSSKLAKEQTDAAAARARGNIQRSITILHDIYDAVMDDKKFLRDFEYLYGGGHALPTALRRMAIVNRRDEEQIRGVKGLVQRWSSREFEIESEPLLEEAEGRWQAAEEERTMILHKRLSGGIDRGPEAVCESAEREIMNAPRRSRGGSGRGQSMIEFRSRNE